ncbi:MAG: DUF4407 domain-containing protein [Bacteroidota bacterium]
MEVQNKKVKPSRFKVLMWHIAGSDINVLRDCVEGNVQNKHAGVGFTILVTTLVAGCVSSIAGYTFGESVPAAIAVGCVWGIVIFSVDRNMVMFLKKDPENPKKGMWSAFIVRALLALLISIFIAIPLELLIFKQEIAIEMENLKNEEFIRQQETKEEKFNINQLFADQY